MRFTKLVSSKTSSVDRQYLNINIRHVATHEKRPFDTRTLSFETRVLKQEFFSWLRRDNSPWDAEVIPLSFGVNEHSFLNLTNQNRLCDLPEHRVITKSSRYIYHKVWNVPLCLSHECLHITEISSRRSRAFRCSLPRV